MTSKSTSHRPNPSDPGSYAGAPPAVHVRAAARRRRRARRPRAGTVRYWYGTGRWQWRGRAVRLWCGAGRWRCRWRCRYGTLRPAGQRCACGDVGASRAKYCTGPWARGHTLCTSPHLAAPHRAVPYRTVRYCTHSITTGHGARAGPRHSGPTVVVSGGRRGQLVRPGHVRNCGRAARGPVGDRQAHR